MNRYATHTAYLLCRTVGHAWDVIDATKTGRHGGNPVWLRCERCGTERHDAINNTTGELIGRNYVYNDTYRHAFDDGLDHAVPSRSDFRRMLLTEHIIQARDRRATIEHTTAHHPSQGRQRHAS